MTTQFEDLPNEILLNIFEYVACPEMIYNCFQNLNQRFNSLLKSLHLNIDILVEDQQFLFILRYFSTRCHRLRLDNICPSIDLEYFPQLRSLTIIEPTDAQINSIQSRTLPMLECLSTPASFIIFDCLFNNQWSYLHSCNFYFSFLSQIKSTWQINRTLRTLIGLICSRLTLSQLLSLLPCLKHLHIDLIANDSSNWNRNLFEINLQTLRIGFSQFHFDDLEILIGNELTRLHIDFNDEQSTMNFRLLGNLLTLFAPNLRRFYCDYRGQQMSFENIRYEHNLFRNIEFIRTHSNDFVQLKLSI